MKREIFLTYEGLLHVLFASHNDKTKSFRKWATETLFTAQMGTKEQKHKLVSDIMGVYAENVKEVFNKDSHTIPCVYLFTLGTVKELRSSMNIDDSHNDNSIVCKYGFTKDLARRTSEHMKIYGKIKNVELKLKYYAYLDPQYISDGEKSIKDFAYDLDLCFEYEKYDELMILPTKFSKQIKEKYEYIRKKYAGHSEELQNKITQLENDIKYKDHEIELLKHANENEILKYKLQLMEKDNEILKLQLNNK